ncbi:MAG: NAD(P)-dependent oxidoreductase [Candidatus Magasanikbacteria bacterium]|jgi:D-lactate dehydrogenase
MSNKTHVVFYGIWPEVKEYARHKMKGISCHIHEENVGLDVLEPNTEILVPFIEAPVNKAIFDKLPKLKMVATMSTGYDHIDIQIAKARHIPVCNVPTYGENTVAEHTMALLLGLTRKIFSSVKRVKEADFDYRGLIGMDIKGKTIGVVGTGHIGAHLIKMAKGFDMNVVAFDPYPNKDLAEKLGFKYVKFDKLLSDADIISLHVPLLPTTYHLINKKNIKKIKQGAYLINTARGALIAPEALVWALENNWISGAGLDVLEDENYLQHEEKIVDRKRTNKEIKTNLMNNIIIDHEKTIVTPHNAFNSTQALQRIVDSTIENIKSYLSGKTINDVTAPKPVKK